MVWDGCEHHLCIRTPAYSVLWAPGAGRGVRPSITAVKSLLYSRGKEGGKTKAAETVPAVDKAICAPSLHLRLANHILDTMRLDKMQQNILNNIAILSRLMPFVMINWNIRVSPKLFQYFKGVPLWPTNMIKYITYGDFLRIDRSKKKSFSQDYNRQMRTSLGESQNGCNHHTILVTKIYSMLSNWQHFNLYTPVE